jgi:hypothetical protein
VVRAGPQSKPRMFRIEKLDSGLLQDGDHFAERFRSGPDGAVKLLHPLDGAEGHLRFPRQLSLRPVQESASRPDLPSANDDHGWTLSRA